MSLPASSRNYVTFELPTTWLFSYCGEIPKNRALVKVTARKPRGVLEGPQAEGMPEETFNSLHSAGNGCETSPSGRAASAKDDQPHSLAKILPKQLRWRRSGGEARNLDPSSLNWKKDLPTLHPHIHHFLYLPRSLLPSSATQACHMSSPSLCKLRNYRLWSQTT